MRQAWGRISVSLLLLGNLNVFANEKCETLLAKQMLQKPVSVTESASLLEALRSERAKRTAKSFNGLKAREEIASLNTVAYQADVVNELIELVDHRSQNGVRPPLNIDLAIRARRNDFMKALYDNNMVDADVLSFALSDKLVTARLLEHYLGEGYVKYHPKTEGLVDFLSTNGLLAPRTGRLAASEDEVREAFAREFPDGFIIKPASGWSSKGRTFFKDIDETVEALFDRSGQLYSSADYHRPFFSDALGHIVSGEKYVIQGRLGLTEGLAEGEPHSKASVLKEYRSHSLWGNVVPKTTKGRWIGANPSQAERLGVVAFLQDFLDSLPKGLRQAQAWSYDVVEVSEGHYGIVEINTNRGMRNHWSGSMHNPFVIGGHVRHLENQYGWKFRGLSGFLLRYNRGNKKRYKLHNQSTRENHNAE